MTGRRIGAALCALSLLFANGCSVLRGTYSSITPHIEAASGQNYGGVSEAQASDYNELRNAILRIVESGATSGTVTITRYTGDIQSDVLTACREVQATEPLGAYAVEYMSYECVNVLTHYEATIEVTYRKTPEQIAQIVDVTGTREFSELLSSAINLHQESLVAHIRYYYGEQYNAEELARTLLTANPASFVAQPVISVGLYPEGDVTQWSRIIDIQLDWGFTREELWHRQEEFVAVCADIVAGLDQEAGGLEKVHGIIAWMDQLSFLDKEEESSSNTPYSALVEKVSASRGAAGALAALCDVIGVERRIVTGTLDGETHYWNMLRLGRDWYHVDLTGAAELLTDEQISDGYEWNITSYPVCRGESLLGMNTLPPDDEENLYMQSAPQEVE